MCGLRSGVRPAMPRRIGAGGASSPTSHTGFAQAEPQHVEKAAEGDSTTD